MNVVICLIVKIAGNGLQAGPVPASVKLNYECPTRFKNANARAWGLLVVMRSCALVVVDSVSTEMLSTGMPEVFENENSFVRRKLSLEMSAAIGTNGLQACAVRI